MRNWKPKKWPITVSDEEAMARIREFYDVPAEQGGKIKLLFRDGKLATILSADKTSLRLFAKADDTGERMILHPTWKVEYL